MLNICYIYMLYICYIYMLYICYIYVIYIYVIYIYMLYIYTYICYIYIHVLYTCISILMFGFPSHGFRMTIVSPAQELDVLGGSMFNGPVSQRLVELSCYISYIIYGIYIYMYMLCMLYIYI